jgi:hypothetical protein
VLGTETVAVYSENHIVAYTPFVKQLLSKQRPFLGSGSQNTFPLLGSRFFIVQQFDYNNRTVFYMVRAEMFYPVGLDLS